MTILCPPAFLELDNYKSGKLPILISVPHGGDEISPEIRERVTLTNKEIFDDSDALTREIYAFQNEVTAYIDTLIVRAFVDLNRAPSDPGCPPNRRMPGVKNKS